MQVTRHPLIWLLGCGVQPSKGKWRKGAPMLEPRGYGAAASLRSSVLFMGGGNGSTWMNSVLRYDLTKGSWEQV